MIDAALLKPSQVAPLMGISHRRLLEWIEQGVVPQGAVVRVGRSKVRPHIRLKVGILREHGLLTDDRPAAPAAPAAPVVPS